MKLKQLSDIIEDAELRGDANTEFRDLHYDSRKLEPGDIFFCVPGHVVDGHEFADKAQQAGAVALVVERFLDLPLPQLRVPSARKALAEAAAWHRRRPARKLATIGITGTNGKTSTAYLCSAVLEKGGRFPGLVGTIQAHVGDEIRPLSNTTPESLDLQTLLADMVQAGLDSVVMEVSSHALVLDRTHALPFDVAIFTNLSQDHLDFHETMEKYFRAKMKLFRSLGSDWDRPDPPYAVINLDDPYGERICDEIRVPYITYGTHPKAHVRATDVEAGPEGLSFNVHTPVGDQRVELQISGLFNVSNALGAIAAGLAQRIELRQCVRGVESVPGIRGRFELIREGQDYTVVVDYAHTPDGLERLLASAREVTEGRVLLVFGCGGDRDRTKRHTMGQLAGIHADWCIITSDNPRSEPPEEIIDEIQAGTSSVQGLFEREADRASAIARAISLAGPKDTVLIAGKGHETYQIIGDQRLPFDDVAVARQAIRVRLGKGGKPQGRHGGGDLWGEQRRPLAIAADQHP